MLGIGVNVGSAPWAGAGFVQADRLELLVEILAQLEAGYERWLLTAPLLRTRDGRARVAGCVLRRDRERRHRPACPRDRERAGRLGDSDRLTVHDAVTVAASESVNCSAAPFTTVTAGGVVSIVNGTSSDTVPSGSLAVTTAT